MNKILSYFQKKKIKPSGAWTDVWQEEHNKAFVVAHVAQADFLQDLYNAVEKAIADGIPFSQFKKEVKSFDEDWRKRRLPTIYNTNLNVAYNRGRYESMKANAVNRPYWRYKCQFLPGSRDTHKAMHGKIFRWDDPIWNTMFPPNDWGCRCTVEPLREDEVNPADVESSAGNLIGVQQDINSTTAQQVVAYRYNNKGDTFAPSPGWNYNPGISTYTPNMRRYNAIIRDGLQILINAEKTKLPFIVGKHSIIDDLKNANPGFGVLMGTDTNCYAAVYAYEARRRGLNVTAITGNTVQGATVLSGFKNVKFSSFASKSSIEKQMTQYGDGARMEILVTWKNDPNMSHVFVAEQINGKTHFIDPQRRDLDCSNYFNRVQNILATRIDNALFSDKLKNFVLSAE